MIKKSDGKIGFFELTGILFLLVNVKVADSTMAFFIKDGLTGAWLLNLFTGSWTLISLLFLLPVIKHNNGKGLLEISNLYFGKYIGFFFNALLLIIIFNATIYHARIGLTGISILLMPTTPDFVIYTLGFFLAMFVAIRGFETIGRTSWLLTPFYIFTFGLIILLTFFSDTTVHWQYMTPILGPGLKEMLRDSLHLSPHYGEFILIAVFIPFIRSFRDFKKSSLLMLIYTIFATSLFLVLALMIFGYPSIQHSAFPYQDLAKVFNIGKYLYNLESFFVYVWVTAELIRFAIYLYLTTYIFAHLFKINEHEPLILPISFLIFVLGLLLPGLLEVLEYRDTFLQFDWIVFNFLPPILWLKLLWDKRRKHREKIS